MDEVQNVLKYFAQICKKASRAFFGVMNLGSIS